MLGIDTHAARVTWTVFIIGLLLLLVYQARETILVFLIAVFLAYMLTPVVDFIDGFMPRRISRNLSLALVYVVLLGVLVGLGFAIGGVVSDEASALGDRLPKLIQSQDPLAQIPFPEWLRPMRERILEAVRNQLSDLNTNAVPIFKRAVTEVLAHVGSVLTLVLTPILAFFFLKDARSIRDTIARIVTDGEDSIILDEIIADVHVMLGHYIRALVILSAATFTVYSSFLAVTGGQYSILLGGVAAVLEFVPVVGPLAAAVIILLVEGFSGYPHMVWIIVLLMVYRLFQDYVLSPYLMGSGVELHPLLVLFGVLAGEQIAGIPGMFFSVPVLAMLRVVYKRLELAQTVSRVT